MKKYYWSYSEESNNYQGGYDTIEECLEEAKEDDDEEVVYIGEECIYEPKVDMDHFIEHQEFLVEDLHLDEPSYPLFFDKATEKQIEKLENKFNKIYSKWLKKYNLNIRYITNIKKYNLNREEE